MATAVAQLGVSGQDGRGSSRLLPYMVHGATSTNDAIGAVLTQLTADLGGTTLDGLALMTISATETSAVGVFEAACEFGIATGLEKQTQSETRIGFEFGQETIRARRSLSSTRFPTPGTPEEGKAVGVSKDADGTVHVSGVDIPAQSFSFSKTRIFPLSAITNSFLSLVASLDKHVNSTPFAGFPAGEVLFIGTNGTQRSDDEMEVAFRFVQRRNESNITIGDITVPTKKGWEYLDVLWTTEKDPNDPILIPVAEFVTVHQLFPEASFAPLGLE